METPADIPVKVMTVDLDLPQPDQRVRRTLEADTTVALSRAGSEEFIELTAGTVINRLLTGCKFARWTGIEWIFRVECGVDSFFVRNVGPGTWEEVEGEEPSATTRG